MDCLIGNNSGSFSDLALTSLSVSNVAAVKKLVGCQITANSVTAEDLITNNINGVPVDDTALVQTSLESAGGDQTLIASTYVFPVFLTKGITAGPGISLTPGPNDLTVSATVEVDSQLSTDLNEMIVYNANVFQTIPNISVTASNSGSMTYNLDFHAYCSTAAVGPVAYITQFAINGVLIPGNLSQSVTTLNLIVENQAISNMYQTVLNNGDVVTVQLRLNAMFAPGGYPHTANMTANVLRIFGVQ
jgi:hypothetical protein